VEIPAGPPAACGYINVGQSLFFGGFGACVCYTAVWLMHKTKPRGAEGLGLIGLHVAFSAPPPPSPKKIITNLFK